MGCPETRGSPQESAGSLSPGSCRRAASLRVCKRAVSKSGVSPGVGRWAASPQVCSSTSGVFSGVCRWAASQGMCRWPISPEICRRAASKSGVSPGVCRRAASPGVCTASQRSASTRNASPQGSAGRLWGSLSLHHYMLCIFAWECLLGGRCSPAISRSLVCNPCLCTCLAGTPVLQTGKPLHGTAPAQCYPCL